MAQTKPKAGQFYGVSDNGTDGQFLKTDGTGGMSWASTIVDPTITSIDYPGTQTAADPAGGESVIINGTLFASGITCTVGGTSAVTAFNSATQITITTPAKAAGQYAVAVTNPDGGTVSQANFIQYSGVPVWSTASGSLGSVQEGASASFQVTATEGSDTIEYAVTTGTLPTGLSLNTNTGAITGTAPSVSADTTTTFSITATDDENQTSSERSFSITVTNDNPSNHFNTVLYTGNNTTNIINTVGFEPGLVWVKTRDDNKNHVLVDTVRGISSVLEADTTAAAVTGYTDFTSFDPNGFTLAATSAVYMNPAGINMVSWNWKAGGTPTATNSEAAGGVPTSGSVMINGVASTAALAGNVVAKKMSVNTSLDFSIVDFTSVAGSTNQVPHGLSGTPDLFIFKRTDAAQDWYVYTEVIDGSLDYLVLNSNAAKSDSSETAPTATTVYQPTSTGSRDYILYSFKSKPGFSKVGSYTGNGTSQNISTGFKVGFVLIKSATSTQNWMVYDSTRGGNKYLIADSSSAEGTSGSNLVNFYTNGFGVLSSNSENQSGQTFIYLAFAADLSTTTPSLANSFDIQTYAGNAGTQSITGTGFKPDIIWGKTRNATQGGFIVDSVRGRNNSLLPYATSADNPNSAATNDLISFDSNGFTVGPVEQTFLNSAYNQVAWLWKAGGLASINTDGTITSVVSANQAAGFSIVRYETSGVQSIGHGLSAAPELVIQKSLNVSGGSYWGVYSAVSGMGTGKLLRLNENSSVFTDSFFFSAVGNSTFTTSWSGTNYAYINYCFRSISGYSKVGTYTGSNASGKYEATGFQPSFLMIKGINYAGYWVMLDDKRVTGNNKWGLYADGSWSESNSYDVSFDANGFTLNTTDVNLNGSYEYLYLAIKEN